jgi:hypothetical protein
MASMPRRKRKKERKERTREGGEKRERREEKEGSIASGPQDDLLLVALRRWLARPGPQLHLSTS